MITSGTDGFEAWTCIVIGCLRKLGVSAGQASGGRCVCRKNSCWSYSIWRWSLCAFCKCVFVVELSEKVQGHDLTGCKQCTPLEKNCLLECLPHLCLTGSHDLIFLDCVWRMCLCGLLGIGKFHLVILWCELPAIENLWHCLTQCSWHIVVVWSFIVEIFVNYVNDKNNKWKFL